MIACSAFKQAHRCALHCAASSSRWTLQQWPSPGGGFAPCKIFKSAHVSPPRHSGCTAVASTFLTSLKRLTHSTHAEEHSGAARCRKAYIIKHNAHYRAQRVSTEGCGKTHFERVPSPSASPSRAAALYTAARLSGAASAAGAGRCGQDCGHGTTKAPSITAPLAAQAAAATIDSSGSGNHDASAICAR